jgi:hypothetical protein
MHAYRSVHSLAVHSTWIVFADDVF